MDGIPWVNWLIMGASFVVLIGLGWRSSLIGCLVSSACYVAVSLLTAGIAPRPVDAPPAGVIGST